MSRPIARPVTRRIGDEGVCETYCSACRRWSLSGDWDDHDEWGAEGEHLKSAVVCPRCGQHYPPYDPATRRTDEEATMRDDRWGPIEATHCSSCGFWSRSDAWEGHHEMLGSEVVGSAVVCPICGQHHPPHDPPSRRITNEEATMHDDRWGSFDEDELQELLAGCEERAETRALPEEIRRRVERLSSELGRELKRRRGLYRGPGVYRGAGAEPGGASVEYEVYGVLDTDDAVRRLVVRPDPKSELLTTVAVNAFERTLHDGQPSYEWVRPLPGREER